MGAFPASGTKEGNAVLLQDHACHAAIAVFIPDKDAYITPSIALITHQPHNIVRHGFQLQPDGSGFRDAQLGTNRIFLITITMISIISIISLIPLITLAALGNLDRYRAMGKPLPLHVSQKRRYKPGSPCHEPLPYLHVHFPCQLQQVVPRALAAVKNILPWHILPWLTVR